MAEYRGGFGRSTYGSYNFGLDGFVTDGAGAVVAVSATASSAIRARLSGSIVITASGTTASAGRDRNASATSSCTAFGGVSFVFDVVGSSTIPLTSSATATSNRVQSTGSTIAASATNTSGVERVREVASNNVVGVSGTASSGSDVNQSGATITTTSSVTATPNRVMSFSGATSASTTTTCNAIEKWEIIPKVTEIWTAA